MSVRYSIVERRLSVAKTDGLGSILLKYSMFKRRCFAADGPTCARAVRHYLRRAIRFALIVNGLHS
jgi:hypothetical protein